MEVQIEHSPGNAAAKIKMKTGESVTAEAGAMIAMGPGITIETTTYKKGGGSVFKALKRMLAGESFFLNHFSASQDSEIWVGPVLAGDLMTHQLNNETLVVQSGSFMAAESSVEMDMGWQGFKSMFSGESMFWLKMSGSGKIVLSSFGAIYPLQVDGAVIVDTGHIVAFDETLNFTIRKASKSLIGSILGGEGLVTRFEGKGTVWCQSHNATSFGQALGPLLRPRSA